MRIGYLEEFIAVATSLSFNQTARALHISQSPLSKHIAALEEDVYKRQVWDNLNNRLTWYDSVTGMWAVSYTHLDVYKRQVWGGLGRARAAGEGARRR